MIVYLKKIKDKLVPESYDDKKNLDLIRLKTKDGERIRLEIQKDRSTKQHRLYWSMLQYAIENSEKISNTYKSAQELHIVLKHEYCALRPEMYRVVKLFSGEKRRTVFSESPYEMKQKDFDEYFSFAEQIVSKVIGYPILDTMGVA